MTEHTRILNAKPIETVGKPLRITPFNIMYWDPELKELVRLKEDIKKEIDELETKNADIPFNNWSPYDKEKYSSLEKHKLSKATMANKAIKFLEFDCIERTENGFICKPIPGYNQTTYTIKDLGEVFECNCQGFQTKLKNDGVGDCTHCLAVKSFIFMEQYNRSKDE